MLTKTFVIDSPIGLHARPAAVLVDIAGKFRSNIIIKYNDKQAVLKSIIGVMALGAGSGASVEVTAAGPDEEEAMLRLDKFFMSEIREL